MRSMGERYEIIRRRAEASKKTYHPTPPYGWVPSPSQCDGEELFHSAPETPIAAGASGSLIRSR